MRHLLVVLCALLPLCGSQPALCWSPTGWGGCYNFNSSLTGYNCQTSFQGTCTYCGYCCCCNLGNKNRQFLCARPGCPVAPPWCYVPYYAGKRKRDVTAVFDVNKDFILIGPQDTKPEEIEEIAKRLPIATR